MREYMKRDRPCAQNLKAASPRRDFFVHDVQASQGHGRQSCQRKHSASRCTHTCFHRGPGQSRSHFCYSIFFQFLLVYVVYILFCSVIFTIFNGYLSYSVLFLKFYHVLLYGFLKSCIRFYFILFYDSIPFCYFLICFVLFFSNLFYHNVFRSSLF